MRLRGFFIALILPCASQLPLHWMHQAKADNIHRATPIGPARQ